jgi:hypothetical protein
LQLDASRIEPVTHEVKVGLHREIKIRMTHRYSKSNDFSVKAFNLGFEFSNAFGSDVIFQMALDFPETLV